MFASLPDSSRRVRQHTAADVNAQIDRQMKERLRYFEENPQLIGDRLIELDREWDIERVLETNATALSLLGLGLGTFVNRWFYLLTAGVVGFLMQHALQGWCPPVPLFRKRGVRTRTEIEKERYALKAMRGDFDKNNGNGQDRLTAAEALKSVEKSER